MEKKYDPERVSAESQKALVARMLDEMNKSPTGAHPNSGWHEMRKVLEEARIPPPMTLTERNDNIAAVVMSYFNGIKACVGQSTAVNFGRWDDEHVRLLNEYCGAKVDPTEIPEPPLTARARNDRIAQIMVAYYRSERTQRPQAEKVSFVGLQQYEKEQLNRLCSATIDQQTENSSSDRFLPPMPKNLSQILNNFQSADRHTVEQIRDCLLFPLWLRGAAGAELAERVRLNNLK